MLWRKRGPGRLLGGREAKMENCMKSGRDSRGILTHAFGAFPVLLLVSFFPLPIPMPTLLQLYDYDFILGNLSFALAHPALINCRAFLPLYQMSLA